MRRVFAYLLIVAACAVDPEPDPGTLDLPFPGEGTDGKADGASDQIARLQDPDRASLPFECQGPELSTNELVAAFDPGRNRLEVRHYQSPHVVMSDVPSVSAILDKRVYTRRCNPVTGCSPYAVDPLNSGGASDWPVDFTITSQGQLGLLPLDGPYEREIDLGVPVAGAVVDVIYRGRIQFNHVRMRMTRNPDGTTCVSAVTPVYRTADSGVTYFAVGRGTLRAKLPASDDDEEPVLTPTSACDDTPLSGSEIVATYFQPGDEYSSLEKGRIASEAVRECDPTSGCSTWRVIDQTWWLANPIGRLHASALGLTILLEFGDQRTTEEPLIDGEFTATEPFPANSIASGHVGATCVGIEQQFETSLGNERVQQRRLRYRASH